MARFEDAVDARFVLDGLKSQLKSINYNPDLKKYFENLESMVSELSSLEVVARRTGNTRKVEEYAQKLEESILYFEQLILMARLLQ